MSDGQKIFIRTDGGPEIGLGHIIRTLSIKYAVDDAFEIIYITKTSTSNAHKIISETGATIISISRNLSIEEEPQYLISQSIFSENDILIIDHYEIDSTYHSALKKSLNLFIVCIDDFFSKKFNCDAIINHCGEISSKNYDVEGITEFYLGPAYALLRPQFSTTYIKDPKNTSGNFLICFGGADIENRTLEIIKQLLKQPQSEKLHFHIVLGSEYKWRNLLFTLLQGENLEYTIYESLSAIEMRSLMEMCFYAVLPPSTISYEFLTTTGILWLSKTAENQKYIEKFLLHSGLAFNFSDFISTGLNIMNSENLIEKQKRIFDGKAQKRLKNIFTQFQLEKYLLVRKAAIQDSDIYFNWANDYEVRFNSFNPEPIIYDDHIKWFNKKLRSENTIFYIFEKHGNPVGQVRFDIENKNALIDYSVAKNERGKGIGLKFIKMAAQQLNSERKDIEDIIAVVKVENSASCKVFEKLGFAIVQENYVENDFICNKYLLRINNADHYSKQ